MDDARTITITLDGETARKYRNYYDNASQAKSFPEKERLKDVIKYALADWMGRVGEGHLEGPELVGWPVGR